MIKYFCDLCGEEIHGTDHEDAERVKYKVSVSSMDETAAYESVYCACPGCASVIMDTISRLRVEEP
jgi:hypothetical protein